MSARPCPVLHCTGRQELKVTYTTVIGKTNGESWAKVCRKHAVQANFPVSWGTIIKVERI